MKPYEIKLIKTCKSTNDYLIEDALQGAQEGKSIISLKQTKGRGTKNNSWISDYGNIFLSTLLRPKGSKKYWPQLSLLAGLSVFETLLEIGVNRKDIKIKWPNDILLNFKKVSGILVESIDNFAVIGIGLNLKSSPKFVTGEFKATNLSNYHRLKVNRIQHICDIMLCRIFVNYKKWNKKSLKTFLFDINLNLAFIGQNILFTDRNEIISGKLIGVNDKGLLDIFANNKNYEISNSEGLFYLNSGEENVSGN